MGKRIEIREKAVEQQRKGKITSCGSLHAPKVARVEKYAEALRFYRTIPYAARIAAQTNVSRGGFYEHLQTRHKGPVCRRKGIPYAEGIPIGCRNEEIHPGDKSQIYRSYRTVERERIADGQSHCRVQPAAGVFPAKEHKPELHARQDMVRAPNGCIVARRSMENTEEPCGDTAQRPRAWSPSPGIWD